MASHFVYPVTNTQVSFYSPGWAYQVFVNGVSVPFEQKAKDEVVLNSAAAAYSQVEVKYSNEGENFYTDKLQKKLDEERFLDLSGFDSVTLDELLFVDSNTTILASPTTKIVARNSGGLGKALLKCSNAHWFGTAFTMAGLNILFASHGTPEGTGFIRRSGNTLFYRAPGDSEGAGVAVTVGAANSTGTARYELASGNPAFKLHVCVSQPTLNGTTHPVFIHKSTGAKAVTWSRASNVTTVTEPGHGREAGDAIVLCGSGLLGQAFVSSVVDKNTYTFRDSRGNASGSGEIFGRRNIKVIGGVWDCNMSVNTVNRGWEDRHGFVCLGVTNLKIDCEIRDPIKYGVYLQAVANWDVNVRFWASNPAGSTAAIQCNGHALNGRLSAHGRSTDTLTALIGGDFPTQTYLLSTDEGGCNFTDTVVENLDGYQCKFELCRIALAAGGVARNTTIRNVRGLIDTSTQLMSSVSVIYDALLHNPGDYSIVDLVVDGVQVDKSGANHLQQVAIAVRGAVASRGIKVRNVHASYPLEASGNGFIVIGAPNTGSCTYDDVEVSHFRHTNPTWQGYAVITQNTGTMRSFKAWDIKVVIDNALKGTSIVSACFSHETAITMDRCHIDECSMEDVSAGGTKSDVWRIWTNGGAIDSFIVTRMKCRNTISLGNYNSTATTTNIIMDDVDVRSSATIFGIRVDRAPASITVGNVRSVGTVLTDLIRIGYSSATVVIRSTGGLYTPSGGSGRHVNIAAGTANAPSVQGVDLWADPAQMAAVQGSICRSTAAGNPVVYRNATAFVELA